MTIFAEALGHEHVLVVDTSKLEGGVTLCGPRGVTRAWRYMQGRDFAEAVIRWARLEDPPRLAVQVGEGTSDFDTEWDDPNIVKLAGGSSFVEIVDVPSGERTARVKHFVDGAFTWSPDGNTLWLQTAGPLLRGLDGTGVEVAHIDAPEVSEAHERMWFDAAGRRAFVHGPFMNPFVAVVDVVARRVLSQRPVATRDACANRDVTRAFAIHGGDRALYRWDIDGGAFTAASPIALPAYASSSSSSSSPDRLRLIAAPEALPLRLSRVWCDGAGGAAVVVDESGRLWRTGATLAALEPLPGAALPLHDAPGVSVAARVDVDAGVALEVAFVAPHARASFRDAYVRVHDLARGGGAAFEVAGTSAAALCCDGRVFVVRDGAAHVLVDGALRLLEGPSDLLHLAPRHSGGVLAVDARGRVYAIDDGGTADSGAEPTR